MNSNPALIVITVVAIAVRLAFLAWQVHHPGFEWSNPDGYLQEALALTRDGSWRWTFDTVEYLWGSGTWVLPPGYPVFLSIFYQEGDTSPMGAAVAQCVIGGLAVLPVYVLGRALHTPRAGLIAASIWALWFPSVAGRHVFIQEQLYLPLLWMALAALAMCLDRWSAPRFFVLAGTALALATLTRAMPLYFVPLLVIGVVFAGPVKSEGLRRSLAMLAGFVLVVGPYVAWLGLRYGELILVDNHMAIWQATSGTPPGLAETARLLMMDLVKNAGEKLHLVRNLFQVSGFNWAHHYSPARGPDDAWWLGLALRTLHDGLFVLASVLAPIGLAFARQRRVAVLLLGWTVLVAALTVAAGYSGARYRTPFEAALVCAAAVPLGGGFRRPHLALTLMGVAASVMAAVIVLPQYQRNVTAPVPYGLSATGMPHTGQPAIASGQSGFYALATKEVVSLELAVPEGCPDLMFDVSADASMVSRVTAAGGESVRARVRVGSRQRVFFEVKPARLDGASSAAISYSVRVVVE